MTKPFRKVGALITAALMAVALIVAVGNLDTQPAEAHTVTGCALRQVKGSYNWTWSSDTYDGHASPTNCEVQSRLARSRGGSRIYYRGSWGIIKSYLYTNSDYSWYGSGRNCARIKVPSTGYISSWACAN